MENRIISKADAQPAGIQIPTGVFNDTLLNSTYSEVSAKDQVILQSSASEDLAIISWPPFQKLPKPKRRPLSEYYYNVLAGVDSYVYVIDSGINEEHVVRDTN